MKIKVTSLYVDNQDKALRFYTDVLGFAKKTDFSQGPYRWLTVVSSEEPDGIELQALNNNPAAQAYQQAIFQQNQAAIMFFTDDIKGDYERIKARGDRKSTRLNSSHLGISYAVFCLKKKNTVYIVLDRVIAVPDQFAGRADLQFG